MPIISGGSTTSGGRTDGWIATTDTWTFATASTFTITGVDRTTVYTPGTLLKLTQSATTKYFVVASSAFVTDTTVTVMVNTDYTLANAAITGTFYSYMSNPQGFPGAFNFTPGTVTGWAATPTVSRATITTIGRWAFLDVRITGTSNATTVSFTVPLTGVTTADTNAQVINGAIASDNTTSLTTPARVTIASNSTTVTLGKDYAGAAWTATGTKTINFTGSYRF